MIEFLSNYFLIGIIYSIFFWNEVGKPPFITYLGYCMTSWPLLYFIMLLNLYGTFRGKKS